MFDQVTLFMVFLMLCFAGIAAMFYFILRGLDELSRELKGERSQLIGLLQSMEASVDILVKVAQISVRSQAGANQAGANQAGGQVGGQAGANQAGGQLGGQLGGQAAASKLVSSGAVASQSVASQPITNQPPINLAETRAAQNLAAKAAAGLNLNYQPERFQNSGNEESVFEETSANGIPSLSLGAQQNGGAGGAGLAAGKRNSSPGLSLKK